MKFNKVEIGKKNVIILASNFSKQKKKTELCFKCQLVIKHACYTYVRLKKQDIL